MNRAVLPGILLLSIFALPLHAFRIANVDEVIRLYRAGVSEELIDAFVEASEPFEVTPQDVVAMEEAGLSAELIDAVVAAGERWTADPLQARDDRAVEPESDATEEASVASAEGEWCRTFDPPVQVLIPQYLFPPWLWDPFWFMPRFDSRIASGPDPRMERTRAERVAADSSRIVGPRGERQRTRPTPSDSAERSRLEPPERRPANVNTAIAPPERGSSRGQSLPHPPLRPNS